MKLSRVCRDEKGFTLMEITVVVCLIGIMVGFSYSGYSSWQKKQRLRSVGHQFADCLQEIRMLSVEKRTSHTIVFGVNEYTLFEDLNSNCDIDDDERVIRRVKVAQWDPDITITVPDEFVVRYDMRGVPRTRTGAYAGATITFSREDGRSFNVVLSNLGKIRYECVNFNVYECDSHEQPES